MRPVIVDQVSWSMMKISTCNNTSPTQLKVIIIILIIIIIINVNRLQN